MMWRVLSNILSNHGPKAKVKSEKAGICYGVPSTAFYYGKCSKISNTLKLRTPKIIAENNV